MTPLQVSIMSETVARARGLENERRSHFPAGLKVLVVDDDAVCLKNVVVMLRQCNYKVSSTTKPIEALEMLRKNKNNFDIVIADVGMPNMDGFELLKMIGLEMDIPVIMMSENDGIDSAMKGVELGARDYLVKPLRLSELRNIWQHVMRKTTLIPSSLALTDLETSENLPRKKQSHRGFEADEEETSIPSDGDSSTRKKPRFSWSNRLHQKFVDVVHTLGADEAVPKKILETMNEPQLTREIIASHLQKYRNLLKKQHSSSSQEQNNILDPNRRYIDLLNARLSTSFNNHALHFFTQRSSGKHSSNRDDEIATFNIHHSPNLETSFSNQRLPHFPFYHQNSFPVQNYSSMPVRGWVNHQQGSSLVPNIGHGELSPNHFTSIVTASQPVQGSLPIVGHVAYSCPPQDGSLDVFGTSSHVLSDDSSQTFEILQPDSRTGTILSSLLENGRHHNNFSLIDEELIPMVQ